RITSVHGIIPLCSVEIHVSRPEAKEVLLQEPAKRLALDAEAKIIAARSGIVGTPLEAVNPNVIAARTRIPACIKNRGSAVRTVRKPINQIAGIIEQSSYVEVGVLHDPQPLIQRAPTDASVTQNHCINVNGRPDILRLYRAADALF